jgi:ubiquinone/menaquinone biosynthesis C-methylase UbiE
MKYEIEGIAFIGRTYEEYSKMFDLNLELLKDKAILDCPAGGASFASELCLKGYDVTAVDRMYDLSLDALRKVCTLDLKKAMKGLDGSESLFNWEEYKDKNSLKEYRVRAKDLFLKDYQQNNERYIYADILDLPFEDEQFDLVVSSHLLFLYGDRLSFDFHLLAILEMARVVKRDIRIYPLIGFDGKPYPFIEELIEKLAEYHLFAEKYEVPFEFLKGSNQMLRILKPISLEDS